MLLFQAWIRFDGEVLAKEALEKVLEQGEGKLEINDCTMTTEVLEGESPHCDDCTVKNQSHLIGINPYNAGGKFS